MKAVCLTGFGDTSVFKFSQVPTPALGAREIRIRVRASGVNRADTLQRRGLYPPPPGTTDILGLEVAGDVLQCGAEAKRFAPGTRVMALLAGGGYAEEAVVDEGLAMRLPDRLSYTEGAAVPEVFLTAHHNLFFLGGLFPQARVLLHAGASGVGTAGIQLARQAAREIWVTVGSREKATACEKLGARPILYREVDFGDAIREKATGKSVDLILDPVGARYLERNLRSLAPGGTLVLIGLMGGKEIPIDLSLVLRQRLKILGSVMRSLDLSMKRAIVSRFERDCGDWLSNGEISPLVDKVYPVAQVAEAHTRMEANLNIGKIILNWE